LTKICRRLGALLVLSAICGCSVMIPQTIALRTSWPSDVPTAAEVTGVPFYPQQGQWCGPASLASALNHAGIAVTPESLADQVFSPGLGGSLQVEMLATARRSGALAYTLRPTLVDLLREIAAGYPVLILQDNGFGLFTAWHYAVVTGYDYARGELYLHSGRSERLALPFTIFEASWRTGQYWSMLVLPPTQTPATANEADMLVALLAMSQSVAAQRALSQASPQPLPPNPAIAGFQTFLRRWPANELASAALANLYYEQSELRSAETVLRAGLRVVPQSIILRNNLGQILADQSRCAEARHEIEKIPPLRGELARFSADVDDTTRFIQAQITAGQCQGPAFKPSAQ
jgi:hypothetical protein